MFWVLGILTVKTQKQTHGGGKGGKGSVEKQTQSRGKQHEKNLSRSRNLVQSVQERSVEEKMEQYRDRTPRTRRR